MNVTLIHTILSFIFGLFRIFELAEGRRINNYSHSTDCLRSYHNSSAYTLANNLKRQPLLTPPAETVVHVSNRRRAIRGKRHEPLLLQNAGP